MEDGKRKKRNKKNKGKTSNTVDDAIPSSGGSVQPPSDVQTRQDEKHEIAPEQNHQDPDMFTTQSVSVSESEGDLERLKIKGSKVAVLEEIIKDLQNTIISCMEKEASLEKKIEILQNDNELFGKKEISWNLKFEQLQSELHSWSAKEVSLDSRLKSIENDKESKVLEKSISEMLARLEEIDTRLQMQVGESEMSKVNLIEENQELTNRISLLEVRVQHLEDEAAAFRTPAMMVPEVSQQSTALAEDFTTSDGVPVAATSSSSSPEEETPELTGKFPSSGVNFETIIINSPTDGAEMPPDGLPPLDDGLKQSPEIVQIPLVDDREQVQPASAARDVNAADLAAAAVPLSDAPLIGAPFRLISFFAKYVSGADLVKENSQSPGG